MDETALTAMGILLEEMAQESREEIRADESQPAFRNDRRMGRKRANTGRSSILALASSGDDLDSMVKKKKERSKKPRLAAEAIPTDMDTEADMNAMRSIKACSCRHLFLNPVKAAVSLNAYLPPKQLS
ncbi:uncharacterized protein P174DRAFT_423817 [Aspergillus novofumigatus IBT 16806]|uniref:Uncharacterized protein n=1 Tax=Aspergillus novofumigatus (strain IBT 16806) TaxID=1392255 RepID=A0A2I1BZZ4_ASPN1|nr:uncharacterized protein P174DRAFT_423817 [Aspergillus novofumigatus IBT 16806]PKX90956.1 hypothetical protein P174DRAFT_423817 [Aspergillus novofumigatus IBT 16806]